MAKSAKPVPEGFHTITPHLVVKGAREALQFYAKAFGAKEVMVMPGPGGGVMHAEMKLGDSHFFINDEFPQMGAKGPHSIGGSPVTIHLYVPDVDKLFNQAVAAGSTPLMPVTDMFWGDRYGMLMDPYGHKWSIATHKEDLTPEECAKRAAGAMGGCGT
jgi:uncharacterized glyoxalase superfamily protein PhnB